METENHFCGTEEWRHFERNNNIFCSVRVEATLVRKKTPFQYVEILRTSDYGALVVSDGWLQSSEYDEFIYHETLVHPCLCSINSPRSVLIGGGGEGATLREVLKHQSVQEVTMVDIDEDFVSICRTHLPQFHKGAFDDRRLTLRYSDIREFLKRTRKKFDAIILDLNAPSDGGNSLGLYSREFYELVQSRLTAEGTMVTYALSAQPGSASGYLEIQETLGQVFEAHCGLVSKLPLDGDWCGFALGFKSGRLFERSIFRDPTTFHSALSIRNLVGALRYLDATSFVEVLHTPRWIAQAYDREQRRSPVDEPELGKNKSRFPSSPVNVFEN